MRCLLQLGQPDQRPGRPARSRLMQALVALPWLLGSALITGLSWPWPTPISLLYPILSSMVLGTAWGRAMRQPYPFDAGALLPGSAANELHLGWALAALAVVVGTVFRLLAGGRGAIAGETQKAPALAGQELF